MQGKHERLHKTLFRWLDKQPLASTLEELQAHVDEFDRIYNTGRPHQGQPGRFTPMAAYLATPKAEPPHPAPQRSKAKSPNRPPSQAPGNLPAGTHVMRIRANGTIRTIRTIRTTRVSYMVDSRLAGHEVLVIRDDTAILVADKSGEGIYEHTRPAPGIAYVGSGRPCGPKPNTPKQSPMS